MSDPTVPPDDPLNRPLPVLRAMIDAIDHEVLRLLARRYGLVGEIAAYKRKHGLPIRDFRREHEIIDDRRSRAVPLGLAPDLIESLFRLILWASRDRQAALQAELPLEVEPRTVAVIGGRGGMGRLMADFFADLGHAVMIADVETELTPETAAAVADVVLISVPIQRTVEVIRRLGPRVRPEALMMDVTSLKAEPVAEMLASCGASVVGTHPLFGPSVHSLQGQRVVVCPGRGDEWLNWLRQMFHARGLIVKEASPQEHDEAMAVVQVLTHFSTEVLGETLAGLGVPVEQTLAFTSPVYLMELLMTARHFAQSPELYAGIEMSNPAAARVTEAFVSAAERLHRLVCGRDHEGFARMFLAVRDYFGPFTDRALAQSSFLIDRLVERD